jgi:hypothetical protein
MGSLFCSIYVHFLRKLSIVFMIRRAGKREALRGERADRLA